MKIQISKRKKGTNCGHKVTKDTKENKIRKTRKTWVLELACHICRGVHLNLVNDKTTDEFILSMKRFCNRRSTSRIIHSDNAKEFIQGKKSGKMSLKILTLIQHIKSFKMNCLSLSTIV